MFATTSTGPVMERSFVMMALRNAGRDAIQSQVSAPFKRFITNSVTENGPKLPNTDAALRWRQRFSNRRSKSGVFHELRAVPTYQIACKTLCQHMRTPMRRQNRCIGTSSIQNFGQDRSLQGGIGAESAQHRHTNMSKSGPFPCPHHHLNLWAALLKLNAVLAMCLHPTEHTRKDARVQPVQNDRLKHNTN